MLFPSLYRHVIIKEFRNLMHTVFAKIKLKRLLEIEQKFGFVFVYSLKYEFHWKFVSAENSALTETLWNYLYSNYLYFVFFPSFVFFQYYSLIWVTLDQMRNFLFFSGNFTVYNYQSWLIENMSENYKARNPHIIEVWRCFSRAD